MVNLDEKITYNRQDALCYMLDCCYYCSWSILRENIISCHDSVAGFLDKIDKAETFRDIHNLVCEYI